MLRNEISWVKQKPKVSELTDIHKRCQRFHTTFLAHIQSPIWLAAIDIILGVCCLAFGISYLLRVSGKMIFSFLIS